MGTLLHFKRRDPAPLIDDEDEFFDAADDMPVAQRIVYIGLSMLCAGAAIAVLALIFTMGR